MFDFLCRLGYKKFNHYPDRGREESKKRKMHVETQTQVFGIQHAPPLSSDCKPHVQLFCLHVFYLSTYSPPLWIYGPPTFPFDSARGKSPALESICNKEVGIDRCAVMDELGRWLSWKWGGQAGKKEIQTTGQSSLHFKPLALGNFTGTAGVCGMLEAQPPS